MAFAGVVVCCYVIIMMGTALVSLGSIASAFPQDEKGYLALEKNLPNGCDTTLDTTLFDGVEGDPASCEWYGPFPPASGTEPDVILPEGTHAISLVTFDGNARSAPLTCLVSVEPAVTFSLKAKRGSVVIELPDRGDIQRLEIYRSRADKPSELKRIARVSPGTATYTDITPEDETCLYAIAVLSGGQWSFSGVRAAHPHGLLPRWNYPPVICSLPVITAYAGLPYTYDVLACDPQDDVLTYSLDKPHPGMRIDPESGFIEWLPDNPGDYETTVFVSDKKGHVVSQTFIIEVIELGTPDRMPTADAGGPHTTEAGQPVAFNGSDSRDPDDAGLSYQWSFGDGHHGSGVLPVHTYAEPGTYQAVLTVTDGRGGLATASSTVTVIECMAPEVHLAVDPAAVTAGEPCSLVWSSKKAHALQMDHGIGTVGSSGSLMIYPDRTATITMTASGRCGTATASVTALVYEPPVLDCSVTTSSIRKGTSTALAWTSSHADTVTIDQGIGPVMPDGVLHVSPAETLSYTITARGPGGTVARSVAIEVLPGTQVDEGDVVVRPPPTVHLTADPPTVEQGQVSIVSWTTDHATAAHLDNGIGEVAVLGTMEVSPSQTTTYTMVVEGEGGWASARVTVQVPVKPQVIMAVYPVTAEAGEECTLTWSSKSARELSIDNGIGAVPLNGFVEVTPDKTTTYTIVAVDDSGRASTGQVTVTVAQPLPDTFPDPPVETPDRVSP
ncbi:MAG TPA: PKD domain-containing protein [Desulfomonilia bacterium]|nr:PKD domain-containing protein [Desulfomonilia bacterium]